LHALNLKMATVSIGLRCARRLISQICSTTTRCDQCECLLFLPERKLLSPIWRPYSFRSLTFSSNILILPVSWDGAFASVGAASGAHAARKDAFRVSFSSQTRAIPAPHEFPEPAGDGEAFAFRQFFDGRSTGFQIPDCLLLRLTSIQLAKGHDPSVRSRPVSVWSARTVDIYRPSDVRLPGELGTRAGLARSRGHSPKARCRSRQRASSSLRSCC
jgi:hypothetical protein